MESIVNIYRTASKEDDREEAMDASVFEIIFETHYKRVYNFVAYRINNHYDVEDLVSAVFEKVIAKYHTYRPSYAPIEAWIISIAKNIVNDYFRGNKKRIFFPLDHAENITAPASKGGQIEEIVVMCEDNSALLRALNTLNDKERTIVAMKFAAGIRNTDIAALMSLSETNVGIIVHRCIKKMRLHLEGESL